MLLIGSRALKLVFPDYREPKDYDVFCTEAELLGFYGRNKASIKHFTMKSQHKAMCRLSNDIQIEMEIIADDKSSKLFHQANNLFPTINYLDINIGTVEVANPYVIFYLKKSHIGFNIHWDKNIKDYSYLKSRLDFALTVQQRRALESAYQLRLSETAKRHESVQGIDPGISNDSFFNRYKVYRVVDHDSIHKMVAYYSTPLFIRLKHNLDSAEVSQDLFEKLNYDDKVKCLQEEAFVLGIERIIIPKFGRSFTDEQFDAAFNYALRRLSTDLKDNPSWIKEFALDNYLSILQYNRNVINRTRVFLDNIDNSIQQ